VLFDGLAREGPYGVDKVQSFGWELVEVEPAADTFHVKVRDVIEHRSGRPVDKAARSWRHVPGSAVVLAFLERQALTPAWLRSHSVWPYSRVPLAMLACWLGEDLRTMPRDERRAVARLYRGVDLTMVWSSNQVDILRDSGFPAETVESIPFGFAPELYPLADPEGRTGPLAAIGSDRGRDYPTLLNAMRGADFELALYCREANLEGAEVPRTVHFQGTVPYDSYRQLLQEVTAVAIPTKVMAYPTGQTVALEAAATGAPVVLTDTAPMREYFPEHTAVFVPPGDSDAWHAALQQLVTDETHRRQMGARAAEHVRSRFTYRQMWEHVDRLFRNRGWAT